MVYISTTYTGKGYEYQICLSGKIYYTFVPYKNMSSTRQQDRWDGVKTMPGIRGTGR